MFQQSRFLYIAIIIVTIISTVNLDKYSNYIFATKITGIMVLGTDLSDYKNVKIKNNKKWAFNVISNSLNR